MPVPPGRGELSNRRSPTAQSAVKPHMIQPAARTTRAELPSCKDRRYCFSQLTRGASPKLRVSATGGERTSCSRRLFAVANVADSRLVSDRAIREAEWQLTIDTRCNRLGTPPRGLLLSLPLLLPPLADLLIGERHQSSCSQWPRSCGCHRRVNGGQ